jgi:hypothetical protein
MSKSNENRVISRVGARELNQQELDAVCGGLTVHTNVCSFDPVTGARDGDACGF